MTAAITKVVSPTNEPSPEGWDALLPFDVNAPDSTSFMEEEFAAGRSLVGVSDDEDDPNVYEYFPDGRVVKLTDIEFPKVKAL